MDSGPIGAVLQHIRQLAAVQELGQVSGAKLLTRFLEKQEEAAFAALLHRHGPMVWRVCQRVLHHRHNAEDVFQATFLTLARKAAAIRKHDSVACWLHGVAYRLSRRLKAELARTLRQDSITGNHAANDPVDQANRQELQAVLDQELDRLPERFRLPLVLCYLEGKTRDEAAEHLGWSLGTFKRRLDRGRKLLAARLTRRGLTLGIALLPAMLTQDALSAAIPPTLFAVTCKAAPLLAAGKVVTHLVSGRVVRLTQMLVKAMLIDRLQRVATLLMVLVVLVGGAGLWAAHRMQASEPELPQAAAAPVPVDAKAGEKGDVALVQHGAYLVNQVARCGDCHTPRNAKGALDMSRHLQGAPIWFMPKVKKGDWENSAPDITASGRAGKWGESKMTQFLMSGAKNDAPMPSYKLNLEDARAVTAYLLSLPGKNKEAVGASTEK